MWANLRKTEFEKRPLHSKVLSVQVNRDYKYTPEMAKLRTELKDAGPESLRWAFYSTKACGEGLTQSTDGWQNAGAGA